MLPEDQKRILGYFIEEAKDHLHTIEQGLLNLRSTVDDPEMVNEVFRAAHSVKGGAAMLGLGSIQRTSHRMEDYFKLLKESSAPPNRELESMLLRVFDGLQEQFDQLQGPFGLTEDKAQEIMATLEPVFTQVDQHLDALVQTAATSIPEPIPEPPAPTPVKTPPYSEASALQLVFSSDIPVLLREMLSLFKQVDNRDSRKQLSELCLKLHRIGEQFELSHWCHLLVATQQVVTNSHYTYRVIAPIVIRELKMAQGLVLQGLEHQILVSATLRDHLPTDNLEDLGREEALDTLLRDTLSDSGGGVDWVDLFENAGSIRADTAIDSVEELNAIVDSASLASLDANDFSNSFSEIFDSMAPPRANENPTDTSIVSSGPEVGSAELNSLADLFEGEISDLDQVWEEEDVADTNDLPANSAFLDTAISDEFADLLLEQDSSNPQDISTNNQDLESLFGGSLLSAQGEASSEETDRVQEELDLGDFITHPPEAPDPASAALESIEMDFSELYLDADTGTFEAISSGNEAPADALGASEGKAIDAPFDIELPTPPKIMDENGSDSLGELWVDDALSEDLEDIAADLAVDSLGDSNAADSEVNFSDLFSTEDSQNNPDIKGGESALETWESEEVSPEALNNLLATQAAELELLVSNTNVDAADLELSDSDMASETAIRPDSALFADDTESPSSAPQENAFDFSDLDLDTASGTDNDLAGRLEYSIESDFEGEFSDLEFEFEAGSETEPIPNRVLPLPDVEETFDEIFSGNVDEEVPIKLDGLEAFEARLASDITLESRDLEDFTQLDIDSGEANENEIEDLEVEEFESPDSEDISAVAASFFGEEPTAELPSPSLDIPSTIEDFFEESSSEHDLLLEDRDFPSEFDEDFALGLENPGLEDPENLQTEAFQAIDESPSQELATQEVFDDITISNEFSEEFPLENIDFSDASESDAQELDLIEALGDIDLAASDTEEAAATFTNANLDTAGAETANLNLETPADASLENSLLDTDEFGDLDPLLRNAPEPLLSGAFTPNSFTFESLSEAGAEWASSVEDVGEEDTDLENATLENASLEGGIGVEDTDAFAELDVLLLEPPLEVESSDSSELFSPEAAASLPELNPSIEDTSEEHLGQLTANPPPLLGAIAENRDDEFDDLEKLLEEADQLGGSTPTSSRRRSQPSASRRPSRRSGRMMDPTMRVSVNHLDNLSNLVGELVVNRNSLEQDQERLRQFLENLLFQVQQLNDVGQRMRDLYERSLLESSLISSRQAFQNSRLTQNSGLENHATGANFDALEMDRFTGFHTLTQEMIELIVRVRESASDIGFTIESADQVTRQFRQVTTQLQEGLNKARMVPFAQTADRLPRAVRDISLRFGKEAKLLVEGRDTLIDKMILERLYDPMTHLVNNAITHGIETPEERIAAGKPTEGTISIRAFYQGNQTVIYIADDGAGINPNIVRAKALQKGIITPDESREMSKLDIYELLFQPGFSTRDQADDFAGRGVGMDVVRTALAEIRGAVTIDSELGKGTSFTIRLPLTLSISKALSCINNQARIAFPMDGVEDMFDLPRERVQMNQQGQSCILWRDTLLPFRPLSDLMQFNRTLGRGRVYGGSHEDNTISIVVLRSANTFIALQVDQVIGEQEIVIKQLEGPVPKPMGIAGATVLGDGRVMPIADVLELIDLSMGRMRREPTTSLWPQPESLLPDSDESAIKSDPTVLIVDDSITVRELLSMSFNKVGYRVEQARDGQEAWEKLRSGLPCDLVFCDIEMPRMDGLELLSRMQKDGVLSQIPIAMLTSRGADRHRQMAIDLGAKGYFTKPYLEEVLLDAAQRMLNGENMAMKKSS